MNVELRALDAVVPYARNPRKNTAAIAKVAASLKEFGWRQPIVVDAEGVVIAGHTRLEAARSLGMAEVPVHVAQGLTPSQVKAYRLADNRVAQEAEWDAGLLKLELTDLQGLDFDLALTGFNPDELAGLLADEQGLLPNADPDDVPETPADPITQPGDVWEMGAHRLVCGDARHARTRILATGDECVGAVVFDPPYDADDDTLSVRVDADDVLVFTDHRHMLECVGGWGVSYRCAFVWDGQSSWYTPGWPLARAKFALWFGRSNYDPDGHHYGHAGEPRVVQNSRGSYLYTPDPRGKHLATVYASPATRQFDGHAHAKPTEWIALLLANCTSGVVFDPFGGSGTTVMACEMVGRSARLIELDPRYCDVIVRRWETATGKQATRIAAHDTAGV